MLKLMPQVSMMKQCTEFKYGQTEIGEFNVQFLTIDFHHCQAEMHLILPRNRYDLPLVENELTTKKLREMINSTMKRRIEVGLYSNVYYYFSCQCQSSVLNINSNLMMF